MPALQFYALDVDLDLVLDRLNADAEIAFIVADGARRWRAIPRRTGIPAGHHLLWHRGGGPLPLVGPDGDDVIQDPVAGWQERVPSAIRGVPFFGSVPMVISWDVAHENGRTVPMSAFGWIGDRYRAIGHGAPKDTMRWWKALDKWIRDRTRPFPRGLPGSGGGTIAAFPAAAARLEMGVAGEQNPPAP